MIVPIVDWCRCVLIKTNLINVSHGKIVTRILNSEIKFHFLVLNGGQRVNMCVCVCLKLNKKREFEAFMWLFEVSSFDSHQNHCVNCNSQPVVDWIGFQSVSFNENSIIRATTIKSFDSASILLRKETTAFWAVIGKVAGRGGRDKRALYCC